MGAAGAAVTGSGSFSTGFSGAATGSGFFSGLGSGFFSGAGALTGSGFFTGDFYHPFTSYGESVVSEAISEAFTERTSLRPFDALSAWIGSLLELIDASVS